MIPALNEALTIRSSCAGAGGARGRGRSGEILIVDSSTDATPSLARGAGARVLRVPKRGLGRAYMDAIPYIRGPWVLMGDADCTYDFRLLAPFVGGSEGYEYIMGSRWKGSIEDGAMPGCTSTSVLPSPPGSSTACSRADSPTSIAGCAESRATHSIRMDLQSESWEYASEMVLKSVQMELRTAEVPVTFLKDREGRLSHHKRAGWFSPWQAAWINLRAMFVYGSDYFVLQAGDRCSPCSG